MGDHLVAERARARRLWSALTKDPGEQPDPSPLPTSEFAELPASRLLRRRGISRPELEGIAARIHRWAPSDRRRTDGEQAERERAEGKADHPANGPRPMRIDPRF